MKSILRRIILHILSVLKEVFQGDTVLKSALGGAVGLWFFELCCCRLFRHNIRTSYRSARRRGGEDTAVAKLQWLREMGKWVEVLPLHGPPKITTVLRWSVEMGTGPCCHPCCRGSQDRCTNSTRTQKHWGQTRLSSSIAYMSTHRDRHTQACIYFYLGVLGWYAHWQQSYTASPHAVSRYAV